MSRSAYQQVPFTGNEQSDFCCHSFQAVFLVCYLFKCSADNINVIREANKITGSVAHHASSLLSVLWGVHEKVMRKDRLIMTFLYNEDLVLCRSTINEADLITSHELVYCRWQTTESVTTINSYFHPEYKLSISFTRCTFFNHFQLEYETTSDKGS